MAESRITGIEQGRASFAYAQVERAAFHSNPKLAKKYKAYVKKVPMLIKTNGLGPTFAFVKAKGTADNVDAEAYRMLYEQTEAWVKQRLEGIISFDDGLLKTIVNLPSSQYKAVTIEVLALFNWLRRIAEGLIEGEADDTN